MQERERPHEPPILWALGALLAIGALIRSWAYARRGALWTDEAGLALNFVGRGFDEIARPFVYDQYAPYLYLLGDKLVTLALGASEYALRFGSLISGILLLPCVALLAARLLDWRAALFALLLLILNWLSIEYSIELKPYILDAVVSTWLSLLVVPVVAHPSSSTRKLAALGAVGALAPWLSLPSIFTLAASGATLLLDAWLRRLPARAWLLRVAIGAGWLTSFAIHFFTFLNAESNSNYLQSYWAAADAFGPFPLRSPSDLRWYFAKFFYLFNALVSSGGFGLRYVAAIGWIAGLYLIGRENRALPALFGLPVLFLFIASAVHKYIVADRMVLFLMPHMIAPIAVALARLSRGDLGGHPAEERRDDSDPPRVLEPIAVAAPRSAAPPLDAASGAGRPQLLAAPAFARTTAFEPARGRHVTGSSPLATTTGAWQAGGRQLLAAGLAAAFCLTPVDELGRRMDRLQPDGPDIRTALAHLKRMYRPSDHLYIEQQVEWIYAFYARREAFGAPFVLSNARAHDRATAFKPLDDLRGSTRVWVLVPSLSRTHNPNPRAAPNIAKAEHNVVDHLDGLGRRLEFVDAGNTHLYLYDLSISR